MDLEEGSLFRIDLADWRLQAGSRSGEDHPGKLKFIVGKYRSYKQALAEIEGARQMLEDKSADKELKALAEEEIEQHAIG